MANPLNPNRRKVGKLSALELHAKIVEENEEHASRVHDGLQYVKIRGRVISIRDTDEIKRVLGQ